MVIQEYMNPDIWKIEIELPDNPLKTLNTYVIASGGEYLVIDTGFNRPECKEMLLDGLKELDIDIRQTALFLTHMHSDHIGLAELFEKNGCTIYMNALDYVYFRQVKEGNIWPEMEQLFVSEGFPEGEIALQETENQGRRYAPKHIFKVTTVVDGDKIQIGDVELHCIHTPGHTLGHTVLYLEKEQILFSGDHILFDITPNISPLHGVHNALALYRDSLEKVRNLQVASVFPGHRATNGERLRERVEEITIHHQNRLEEITRLIEIYPGLTAYEIAGMVKWDSKNVKWEDFTPHQRWFAMGETLSHLYYMEECHMLRRQVTISKIMYYRI